MARQPEVFVRELDPTEAQRLVKIIQAHPTRVSTLSGPGSSPYPAGYAGTTSGGASTNRSRFPVAFRPPAFASRVVLHPPRSSAFLTVSPPDNKSSSGPRRGCHVPHETDATGVGVLCTPGTVVRSRPAKSPRAAPAASQRPAPISRSNFPSAEVLMTRRQRGFTRFTRPVFPSL